MYVHCKALSLNLAIGHACKEPLVRNMLSTVQVIAFAFYYSAKRLLAFQESLRQSQPLSENNGNCERNQTVINAKKKMDGIKKQMPLAVKIQIDKQHCLKDEPSNLRHKLGSVYLGPQRNDQQDVNTKRHTNTSQEKVAF